MEGYFRQNDNYKINIFGTKWWGEMGGQANFSGSGGDSLQSHQYNGNLAYSYERNQETHDLE